MLGTETMGDCREEIEVLLHDWCVNRRFYWRWEEYDPEIVARALGTLFRSWKWRGRIRALGELNRLAAATERRVILTEAAQVIGELLGASAGADTKTVRTRA
jgi:hypothetical protein